MLLKALFNLVGEQNVREISSYIYIKRGIIKLLPLRLLKNEERKIIDGEIIDKDKDEL